MTTRIRTMRTMTPMRTTTRTRMRTRTTKDNNHNNNNNNKTQSSTVPTTTTLICCEIFEISLFLLENCSRMSTFCSLTSLHGWPHLPGSGKGEKIFWTMAILASLGAGGYLGIRSNMYHCHTRSNLEISAVLEILQV